MRRVLLTAFAALGLIGWVDPRTAGPQVTESDIKAEAQRQAVYVFSSRWKEYQRVANIAFRIEVANHDLCADRRPSLGVVWNTAETFDKRVRDAAIEALHLGDGITVVHAVPDSPGGRAGLRIGDVLVTVNGESAPSGKGAAQKADKRLREILDKTPDAPVTLVVRRGAEMQTFTVAPVMACAYGVVVEDSKELNAFADGKTIHINRPMLRLVGDDDELALIIAHELAHNGQHHIQAKTTNARIAGFGGLLLDGIAAAYGTNTQGAFTKAGMRLGAEHASVAFESEADYVGMYYLARAGYATEGVENVWRKFAAETPEAIFIKSSHPVTLQRFLAIAATSKEIEAKRAKGEPLTPNLKAS
jgi:hypothetical protein